MSTSELRQKLQEAHNRFHGRFTTHAEVAKHSRWTAQELESVQIEDEELYYDELLALLAAQKQRWEAEARIDENSVLWKTAIVPHLTRADDSIYIPIRDAMDARIAALDGVIGEPLDGLETPSETAEPKDTKSITEASASEEER